MKIEFDFTVSRWGININGTCTAEYTAAQKGKLYGPPEDCYPDEGAEVDPISISITGFGDQELTTDINVTDIGAFWDTFEDELIQAAIDSQDSDDYYEDRRDDE